ncbi:hypothetical protein BGX20_010460, partial [Mortierella sp. AD010]
MSSAAISSTWRSTFTNVPPLTKTISTAMTVMTTLGLLLRFRDMAMLNYADQDAPNTNPSSSFTNAEATLVPLLALVPVSYKTQAYGLTAVLSGFLVGFKQLVPEHLVTLWGIFSVRVKTLPMLFAVFMIFESLITRSQIQLMMAIYGMFISWVYSRFFKVQDGIRGDRSETFSFASFFPEAAQSLVKPLSNIVFGILVRLRVCSPLGFGAGFQQDLENSGMILPMSQPASLRAEAERR